MIMYIGLKTKITAVYFFQQKFSLFKKFLQINMRNFFFQIRLLFLINRGIQIEAKSLKLKFPFLDFINPF